MLPKKRTHRQITHKNGLGTSNEKEEKVKKRKGQEARSKKQEARAQTQKYLYETQEKLKQPSCASEQITLLVPAISGLVPSKFGNRSIKIVEEREPHIIREGP